MQTTTVVHKRQQKYTNDNSSTQTTTVVHKQQLYTNDNSSTQTTTVVHKRQQLYTNDNSFVSYIPVSVLSEDRVKHLAVYQSPYTRNRFRPQSIGRRHVIKTLRPHKRKGIPQRMEPTSIGGPPGLYKLD